jgi:hypothetical protein
MQVENANNYNTLGRMGPIYPRQEFRPPQKNPLETEDSSGKLGGKKSQKEEESLTLSPNLKRKSAQKAENLDGPLSPKDVRTLTSHTAAQITELSPVGTWGCPHGEIQGYGLLYPIYA